MRGGCLPWWPELSAAARRGTGCPRAVGTAGRRDGAGEGRAGSRPRKCWLEGWNRDSLQSGALFWTKGTGSFLVIYIHRRGRSMGMKRTKYRLFLPCFSFFALTSRHWSWDSPVYDIKHFLVISYNPIKEPLLKKKNFKSHFCRKIWVGSSLYSVVSEIPQIV